MRASSASGASSSSTRRACSFQRSRLLTTPDDLRDDPEHAKLVRVLALFYLPPPLSVREAPQGRSTSWNPIACSPSCIPLQDRALVSQTSSSSFFCMSSRGDPPSTLMPMAHQMRREAAECRMGAVLIISPPARMIHWSTSGGSPAALRAAEVTEPDTCPCC